MKTVANILVLYCYILFSRLGTIAQPDGVASIYPNGNQEIKTENVDQQEYHTKTIGDQSNTRHSGSGILEMAKQYRPGRKIEPMPNPAKQKQMLEIASIFDDVRGVLI